MFMISKKALIFLTLLCVISHRLLGFSGFILPEEHKTYPPDITFCIVDLKFNRDYIKVCEFGLGVVSGFYGFERLHQDNPDYLWREFWRYLFSLHIPAFFIDSSARFYQQPVSSTTTFLKGGGRLFSGISEFQRMIATTQHAVSKKPLKALDQTMGILISRQPFIPKKMVEELAHDYPSLMVLDYVTRPFMFHKVLTHLLFADDPALEMYRPKCKILPKKYNLTLSQDLIRDLGSELFVIKPLNEWKGKGVIIVDKKELNHTLSTILSHPETINASAGKALGYWKKDKRRFFIIEAYEPSQSLDVGGKAYDPTMRVALGMHYDQGQIGISYLGAYWKLPKKSLQERGTHDEKRKSHIAAGKNNCSANVTDADFAKVQTILNDMLPKVYKKMVYARHDKNYLPTLYAIMEGRV